MTILLNVLVPTVNLLLVCQLCWLHYFDEYLNFDKHSSFICAKLARSLYCIKRVSNKLSKKSLLSLYYALIHPHLLYCINILSCTSKSNLLRIQKMQKKPSELLLNLKQMSILALYSNHAKFCLLNSFAFRPNCYLWTQSTIIMPPLLFPILSPLTKFVILNTTFAISMNLFCPDVESNCLRNSPFTHSP